MSILVVIGSTIFVALGVVHGIYTLRSSPAGGPMTPTAPDVRAAMELPGGLGLAPDVQTTLWRAWAGFNLSHSLGAVVGGLVIGIPALRDFDHVLHDPWWLALALATPAVYLALSVRYWFREPTIGIALAGGLIAIGIVGGLVST